MKDLVVLTACEDGECALRGLLSRPQALGIRPVSTEFLRHPHRDPGCLNDPEALLRSQSQGYSRALILFDREGSGGETSGSAADLARQVEARMDGVGWQGRLRCVVVDPEIENWVWSGSPHVDKLLGWGDPSANLRKWLMDNLWVENEALKPARPKEAMEAALREKRLPWSSSIFEELAGRVSFRRCTDPAFARLVAILREWFPADP